MFLLDIKEWDLMVGEINMKKRVGIKKSILNKNVGFLRKIKRENLFNF